MYIIQSNRQLDGPREIAEAVNLYFSISIIDIAINLFTLPRLTARTLLPIVFNRDKIEKDLAIIKPSHRHGSDGIPLPYSASANPTYRFFCQVFLVQWKLSVIVPPNKNGLLYGPQKYCLA